MSETLDRLSGSTTDTARSSGIRRSAEHPLLHGVGQGEELITLTEAARLLPRIDGKKVSVCTVWRWAHRGLRGEHLEYARVGRRVCTSPEALQRFFTRLVELDERVPPDTRSLPPGLKRSPVTSKQRQRALAEADAVLRRAGI